MDIFEKRRVANNKQRAKTRQLINHLKSNPCTDCQNLYDTICMDFDHLDTATRLCIDFNQLRGSTNKILEEVKKCELVCAVCHRIRTYNRKQLFQTRPRKNDQNRQKNRSEEHTAFLAIIKDRPCMDCGKLYHFSAMDFDHKNGLNKRYNVANMVGYSKENILAEIAKCDIVCANCHRIRTKRRLNTNIEISINF